MLTWAIVYLLTHRNTDDIPCYFIGWAMASDVLIMLSLFPGDFFTLNISY